MNEKIDFLDLIVVLFIVVSISYFAIAYSFNTFRNKVVAQLNSNTSAIITEQQTISQLEAQIINLQFQLNKEDK